MPPRLNSIVRDLWLWCMNRDITLTAEHLPGVLNTIANEESRVMKDRSDWRLDPEVFHQIQERWGPLEVDMFASRLTTQLERFFSWRPDPEAEAQDAFSQDWTSLRGKGYANPPWNLVGRVPNRVQQQEIMLVLIAPVWKSQPWYPTLLELMVDFPILLPQRRDLIIPTHPETRDDSAISRLAYLRRRYQDKAISEEGTELLLASWRQKSSQSYDSLFRKWVDWCSKRDSDPVSGAVSEVVNFLAHLYREGYQYRSLNAYRSAISSVHERVDGYEIGQHPLVSRVMKGAFNLRPPQPRYETTWDVTAVLNYIQSLGTTESLSLRDLTWKLAMILALTRPSRSTDLVELDLRFRRFVPEGVVFQEVGLAKQSRMGKPRAEFFFPAFEETRLCPVAMILALTRPSRSADLVKLDLRFRRFVPEGWCSRKWGWQSRQGWENPERSSSFPHLRRQGCAPWPRFGRMNKRQSFSENRGTQSSPDCSWRW